MWFQYSASLCCSTSVLHRTLTPPCLHTHTYTHTFAHISTWTFLSYRVAPLQQKPFRSNHFCILEECKICGGHLFSILLVEGDRCVCVHVCVCVWKQECEREITSICEFAVTRPVCGPPLCTQRKEMQSKSAELVSKMSGMLTYTGSGCKVHPLSAALRVCVCAPAQATGCSRQQIKDREVDKITSAAFHWLWVM